MLKSPSSGWERINENAKAVIQVWRQKHAHTYKL